MNTRAKMIFAAMAAAAAMASAETRSLTLPAGRSEGVDLGFVPKGRRIIGKELVSVSMHEGATSAIVTAGETQGSCQVEFLDAGGGEGLLLKVEVVGDLDDTLRSLRKWLSDFNDIEFVKGKSKIAITGTISNPSDWAKFEKICSLSDFKDKIEAVVEFSVDPGTINNLRKELVAEGIPLADAGVRPAEGQIAMDYAHNVLKFTGTVYSAKDVEKLTRVLKGQSWLQIVSEPKGAATSTVAQAVVNVAVDDALLELGVAFVMVSRREFQQRASTGRLVANAVWGGLTDLLLVGGHRQSQHGKYNNVTLNASLSSTLEMLANNGVTRQREQGTLRFHANGDPGKTLHIGGSMKVTPPASGEGEAPEAQDYDYGFKIVNKNSRRISATDAEADIDIELFGEPQFPAGNGNGATTVKQEKRSVSPLVRIPLGQTVAVAGYESLFEHSTGEGTPVLRHIPIVNWFVSDKRHDYDDQALLVLVSIRKVDLDAEAPMVPNTPMRDITLDADTDTETRVKNERDATKKHRGCWEPLNWLAW